MPLATFIREARHELQLSPRLGILSGLAHTHARRAHKRGSGTKLYSVWAKPVICHGSTLIESKTRVVCVTLIKEPLLYLNSLRKPHSDCSRQRTRLLSLPSIGFTRHSTRPHLLPFTCNSAKPHQITTTHHRPRKQTTNLPRWQEATHHGRTGNFSQAIASPR